MEVVNSFGHVLVVQPPSGRFFFPSYHAFPAEDIRRKYISFNVTLQPQKKTPGWVVEGIYVG